MATELVMIVDGEPWSVATDSPDRLSVRLDFRGAQPGAFGMERATATVESAGETPLDTEAGGAVNCARVELTPHANGTHTETVGHVVDEEVPIGSVLDEPLLPAAVLSAPVRQLGDLSESYRGRSNHRDDVVAREDLVRAADDADLLSAPVSTLVLRTQPNPSDKRYRQWGGSNPPYLTDDAVAWLRSHRIDHLVVDLPSIDREDDGGGTPNHRQFWSLDPAPHGVETPPDSPSRTITEMAYVPEGVSDGLYALQIQCPDFALDAAPSRLLLHKCRPG
ncbi:MAG: cyclase family protein [Bradymonadaceae bacterium]